MTELTSLWSEPQTALLWAGFGYLLGSIPFGLILTRMAGLGDVRKIGSGNIGATNVLRTGNKPLAAITLLLDAAKGAVAVLVANRAGAEFGLIAALGAFIGHCYPVWLKFKGGKGVATYLGALAPISWKVGVIFAGFWLATAFVSRISSAAALVACVISPLMLFATDKYSAGVVFLLISLLCVWRHRENIRRMIKGTESKIGSKG
ncbi:MAG: glycerol-3-phosphate 1-O-acyltransferase PlsY [Nitratireductor sp.]